MDAFHRTCKKKGFFNLNADGIAQPDADTQTWTSQHVSAAEVATKEAQPTWQSFHTYLLTQWLQLFIRALIREQLTKAAISEGIQYE